MYPPPKQLNTGKRRKRPGMNLFNALNPFDVRKENSVLIGSSKISTTSDCILIWPKNLTAPEISKFELRKSENFSR